MYNDWKKFAEKGNFDEQIKLLNQFLVNIEKNF